MTSDARVQAQHERHLNDKLRREMPHGSVIIRGGAKQFSNDQLFALTKLIQDYDDFLPDKEADDLHDFGALAFQGVDIVWRIEAVHVEHAACSGTSPTVQRHLIVMLVDEFV